jgi:UDP-N-acetylglucosamine--N-acetylmuramyl-(pentapeptide) pyrophosphoryl-undecaprenol N-acetylglucosamine transferase
LLEDGRLAEELLSQVEALLADPARLEQMARASRSLARPDAAEQIAQVLRQTARRGGAA